MPEDVSNAPRDLRALADEQIRRNVEESRIAFQKASSLRSYFEKYEKPIREREERIRGGAPKGRQWKAFLPECLKLVAEASSLHAQVKKREQAALSHFRNAVAGIRELSGKSDETREHEMIERLEQAVRLRAAEFECLDGVGQLTHQILNLPGNATPVQLYTLLEQRRKYMNRVGSMLAKADELERAALGPGPKPPSEPEEAKAPEHGFEDQDQDDRLTDVEAGSGAPDPENAGEEAEGDMSRKSGTPKAEPDAVEAAFAALARQVADLQALTARERVESERARERARALEAELRVEIEGLSSKRTELEDELESVRGSMEDLKGKVRAREEKLREERKQLAGDRKKIEEEAAEAFRERDEALVLISSLTRRLNTPGIET